MLNSRGYLVPQSDLNMTKEEFRNQYGENPRKDDLVVLVPRQDDPTEQASWLLMRELSSCVGRGMLCLCAWRTESFGH